MTSTRQVDVDAIPAELKARDQWVLWKPELRDGHETKVPYQTTGEKAESDNAQTWTDFDTATERFAIADGFAGVGYVFSADDPYTGVDLDGCRDPATGELVAWAATWIAKFDTYTEVSPSGTGVKLWARGRNPKGSGGNTKINESQINGKVPGVEIYDRGRYFTVTGWHVEGTPLTIEPRQAVLDEFAATYWPAATASTSSENGPFRLQLVERCWCCAQKMPDAISGQGGHNSTFAAACECFRFGLTDSEAAEVLRRFNAFKTGSERWTDKELNHKLADARNRVISQGEFGCRIADDRQSVDTSESLQQGGESSPRGTVPEPIRPLTVRQLVERYPKMRAPVIHGLLREGETMNVIAPPKVGKSWLTNDLALCTATGRPWLGLFEIEPGPVLIIDNELHGETISNRLPRVADARRIPAAEYLDRVQVVPLRGQLTDIFGLGDVFKFFKAGELRLVVLDAFYRAVPKGTDENDNSAVAGLYNLLDQYALRLGCAFAIVHHASKGNQSTKAVTDVGAGAGSQARASDTHLILRQHRELGAYVLDAAVRSWPPVEPRVLRWEFPVWTLADDLDPADLKPDRPPRRNPKLATGTEPTEPAPPPWTPERFVKEFCGKTPANKQAILARAVSGGMKPTPAENLLKMAIGAELLYDWPTSDKRIREYATVRPPMETTDNG